MDSIDSLSLSQSFSASSKKTVTNNFNLAVKYFMNKNFHKSYEIVSGLYEKCFNQYNTGVIPELLFIKVVNLYIIEAGLILDTSRRDVQVKLPPAEKSQVLKQLAGDGLLDELTAIYGSQVAVPVEILYNLHTTLFINKEVFQIAEAAFLTRIESIVYSPHEEQDSPFFKKLCDLYVYEVLPSYNKYGESEKFMEQSPLYSSETDFQRLSQIKQDMQKREDEEKRKKQERLNKQRESEKLEQQRLQEQKNDENLTYKTLKQIKKQAASESTPSTVPSRPLPAANDLALIKQKLVYQLNLSKNYLLDNYPVILVIVLTFLLGTRFIRSRKINLKEKLVDTMKMALKVTYL